MNNIIQNLKNYRIVNTNYYVPFSKLDYAHKTLDKLSNQLNAEVKINTNLSDQLRSVNDRLSVETCENVSLASEISDKHAEIKAVKKENNFHRVLSIVTIPSTALVGYAIIKFLVS